MLGVNKEQSNFSALGLSREDIIRLNFMVNNWGSRPISVVELNDKLTKLKYDCFASILKLTEAGLVKQVSLEVVDNWQLSSLYSKRPVSEAVMNGSHYTYVPTEAGVKFIKDNF